MSGGTRMSKEGKELHQQTFENVLYSVLFLIREIEFVNLDKLYAEYNMRCWYRSQFAVLCADRSVVFDVVADQEILTPQIVLAARQLSDAKIWLQAVPFCKHPFINRLNGFIGEDGSLIALSPNSIILKMIPIWLPVVTVIRPENSGFPDTFVIEVAECVFFYIPRSDSDGERSPFEISDYIVGPFAVGSRVNIRVHSILRRRLEELMLYSVISRILHHEYRISHEAPLQDREDSVYAKTNYVTRKTVTRDGLVLLYMPSNIVYLALQSSKETSSTRLREKLLKIINLPAQAYSNPASYRNYDLERLLDMLTYAAIKFKRATRGVIRRDPTNIDVMNGPMAYDLLAVVLKGFVSNTLQELRTGPLWYLFCGKRGWSAEEAEMSLSKDISAYQLSNNNLLI